LRKSLGLIPSLPFSVVLWETQNICYPALIKVFEENGWGSNNDPAMQQYFENLVQLAAQLQIRTPQLELQP